MKWIIHYQYTATVLAISALVSIGESGPISCLCGLLILAITRIQIQQTIFVGTQVGGANRACGNNNLRLYRWSFASIWTKRWRCVPVRGYKWRTRNGIYSVHIYSVHAYDHKGLHLKRSHTWICSAKILQRAALRIHHITYTESGAAYLSYQTLAICIRYSNNGESSIGQ